ncbi:conserved hypothetical protein [Hyphomicrobiales bacterium]|nr:conserved hypothetical protein [Hyphomicrobiales bacterium]CAH1702239.1 conserved hypothetical protein [Hyphomicrobiales bacterium]
MVKVRFLDSCGRWINPSTLHGLRTNSSRNGSAKAIMSGKESVNSAVVAASRVVRAALPAARLNVSTLSASRRELDALFDKAHAPIEGLRRRCELTSAVATIPLLGRLHRRAVVRLQTAEDALFSIRERAHGNLAELKAAKDSVSRLQRSLANLGKAAPLMGRLGPPGRTIKARSDGIHARATALLRKRKSNEWIEQASACGLDALLLVRDWAQETALAAASGRTEAHRTATANAAPRERRIYLPVPPSLSGQVERLGAIRDISVSGASPWFVTPEMDLQAFGRLLPMAIWPSPTAISMPSLPLYAAGQNLWSLFDRDYWDHVRKQTYAASGHRCTICGGRGPSAIAKAIHQPDDPPPTIQAHEIWDWTIGDEDGAVGVQRLTGILCVCKGCHMLFHSGHARRLAELNGMGDEVAAAIEQRRRTLTRLSPAELAESIAAANERLRELSGISKWVIDLSHIAAQSSLSQITPVLQESNRANVPPEQIAGLAFRTDQGRSFEARDADEVVARMLGQEHSILRTIAR